MIIPKISIIVPVYNVENFIDKCLNSLINQTFNEIEIICINDGSTDNSVKILEKYIEKDSRVKLYHKKNGGLSSARNLGIDKSTAEYIQFCDSDDFYAENMCELLYNAITTNNAEIAICGTNIIYLCNHSLKKSDKNYYKIKYSGLTDITHKMIQRTDCSSWNKIFKKSIIDQYSLRFPEGLYYEDAYFVPIYLLLSNKAFFINEKLYNYLRRENSIMNKTFSKNIKCLDHLKIGEHIYSTLNKHNIFEKNKSFFIKTYISYFYFSLNFLPEEKKFLAYDQFSTFIKKNLSLLNNINASDKAIIDQIRKGTLSLNEKIKFLGITVGRIKTNRFNKRIKFLGIRIHKKTYRNI